MCVCTRVRDSDKTATITIIIICKYIIIYTDSEYESKRNLISIDCSCQSLDGDVSYSG